MAKRKNKKVDVAVSVLSLFILVVSIGYSRSAFRQAEQEIARQLILLPQINNSNPTPSLLPTISRAENAITEQSQEQISPLSVTQSEQAVVPEITSIQQPNSYVLSKGDTLGSVAKRFSTTVKDLMALNQIKDPTRLRDGKTLILPTVTELPKTSVVTNATANDVLPQGKTYILKRGELLGSVAKKFSISVKALQIANNITDPTKIRDGKTLLIPEPESKSEPLPTPPLSVAATTPALDNTHVLKKGELLGTVAKKYSVSVADLLQANNIQNPKRIREGTVLVIPAKQASSSEHITTNDSSDAPPEIPQQKLTQDLLAPQKKPEPQQELTTLEVAPQNTEVPDPATTESSVTAALPPSQAPAVQTTSTQDTPPSASTSTMESEIAAPSLSETPEIMISEKKEGVDALTPVPDVSAKAENSTPEETSPLAVVENQPIDPAQQDALKDALPTEIASVINPQEAISLTPTPPVSDTNETIVETAPPAPVVNDSAPPEPLIQTQEAEANSLLQKGIEQAKTGQTSEAMLSFRQAIALSPKFVEAYYNLGTLLVQQKEYNDAINVLETVTEIQPDYAEAYYNLGYAYHLTKTNDQAVKSFQMFLQLAKEKPHLQEKLPSVKKALAQLQKN